MVGWTDFPAIFTSLKSATDIARAVLDAGQTLDKAELKLKLADLMGALATARTQTAEMQEEMGRLTRELAETQKKLAFAGKMEYEAPYYWSTADGKRDGPYCATCWDGPAHAAIRLYEYSSPGGWVCQTCKNAVLDSDFEDPPAADLEPS